jgi:hypothetical protein
MKNTKAPNTPESMEIKFFFISLENAKAKLKKVKYIPSMYSPSLCIWDTHVREVGKIIKGIVKIRAVFLEISKSLSSMYRISPAEACKKALKGSNTQGL